MYELSLFILDLAQNSLTAGASLVKLWLIESRAANRCTIIVADNGCGMTPEACARALSPFSTTKSSRSKKIGLGLPFFKQLVESCEGTFRIKSRPGIGTVIAGIYPLDNLDQPPLGNLADTLFALVLASPAVDIVMTRRDDQSARVFDTRPVRRELGAAAVELWQSGDMQAWFQSALDEVCAKGLPK